MKMILTVAFGAALVLSPAAFAQSGTAQPQPFGSGMVTGPYETPGTGAALVARHLFVIGKLPIGIWAPVEPHYDSRMNRNSAANPGGWNGHGF
jgi:hypothetical protein